MNIYHRVFRRLPQPVGATEAFRYLDDVLPPIWQTAYRTGGGDITIVTLGGRPGERGAFSYMFDVQPGNSRVDGRLVAGWGISNSEPASTRDRTRMAGLLKGSWSERFPGHDRGHVFAHTMGGGLDINLFPQLASVNRYSEWRRMEEYAVANPGTFCCVRPFYKDTTWMPSEVEYCIFKLPPGAPGMWFNRFPN